MAAGAGLAGPGAVVNAETYTRGRGTEGESTGITLLWFDGCCYEDW
jgi:hypothetical protein